MDKEKIINDLVMVLKKYKKEEIYADNPGGDYEGCSRSWGFMDGIIALEDILTEFCIEKDIVKNSIWELLDGEETE